MKLYKVYVYTEGHPHLSEMIVAAGSEEEARDRALNHVKKNNPTKGERTPEESQHLSKILTVKETGLDGCLVVNKLQLSVCRDLGMKI